MINEHIDHFNCKMILCYRFCCLFSLKQSYLFFRDNVPVIILCTWDLEAEYLDEDYLSGLLPVLFADNVAAAEKSLLANKTATTRDLERLNRIFFVPETVGLEDALKIVKKARAGEGDYIFKNRNLDRLFTVPLPRTDTGLEHSPIHIENQVSKSRNLEIYTRLSRLIYI